MVRCEQVTRRSRLDPRVIRLAQHDRQPAGLEVGAGADEKRGAARPREQAGASLRAVGILEPGRGGVDARFVAGDLRHERAPLGFARKDIDLGAGEPGGDHERSGEARAEKQPGSRFHACLRGLRTDAPRAGRGS